ncbi:MAG: NUDIX domain-containing protein [Candidatus Moranbacteria bacterium]|nr:NUDIX domain-containing protein [Candidatus Moranbacteria bacterium]
MSRKRKKLPKNAKRVFKGVIFDVWHWKQKMFDGRSAIFEKLVRADTVNVIGTVGEKIILLRQKQPDWKKHKNTLAGGRVDEGESPLEAAKRELLEETGYVSKKWKLWKKINPYGKIVWTVHNFVARDCVKKQNPHPDTGEKIKMRMATFGEFLSLGEDKNFYEGELKNTLVRARYDRKFRKEFKKMLFGK